MSSNDSENEVVPPPSEYKAPISKKPRSQTGNENVSQARRATKTYKEQVLEQKYPEFFKMFYRKYRSLDIDFVTVECSAIQQIDLFLHAAKDIGLYDQTLTEIDKNNVSIAKVFYSDMWGNLHNVREAYGSRDNWHCKYKLGICLIRHIVRACQKIFCEKPHRMQEAFCFYICGYLEVTMALELKKARLLANELLLAELEQKLKTGTNSLSSVHLNLDLERTREFCFESKRTLELMELYMEQEQEEPSEQNMLKYLMSFKKN